MPENFIGTSKTETGDKSGSTYVRR